MTLNKKVILFIFLSLALVKNALAQDLRILSSENRHPIEGAVVYDIKNHVASRTDFFGKVTLAEPDSDEIQIKAKYHEPKIIKLSQLKSAAIVMNYNKNLLKAEQQLVHTKENMLWGEYSKYRSNNDLLSYDLTIKVEPEKKYISGNNKIRFKMLKDDSTIQIDLYENLNINKILHNKKPLKYTRESNAVYIHFDKALKANEIAEIDFHYSGYPATTGRFGCFTFQKDNLGKHWINTACQGSGSMVWWPTKDQQRDEVDKMVMRISVPSDLMDVSNGRLINTRILGDGFTEYVWLTNNPINNYSVSLNIGNYVHFGETLDNLTLDYYVLEQDLDKAKKQFKQAKPMMVTYQKYFGEYPFIEDGYKLIQSPYSGMEHQSAVTYGNGFENGYIGGIGRGTGRDWTGVGISLKFDFIIIHETGHEWFGNSLTSNDFSDSWIHEGWCTYAEAVYVEDQFGYQNAIKYINGYKNKVDNTYPLIGPPSVSHWPTSDIYFKGALFINTLRHVINDDKKWWAGVKQYTTQFKKQNFYTTDVLNFFNAYFDYDFEKIFDQYLYFNELPTLEIQKSNNTFKYRFKSNVVGFEMPIALNIDGKKKVVTASNIWKTVGFTQSVKVYEDLYYINIKNINNNDKELLSLDDASNRL
jgi:aminopeptidase N